MRLYFFICSSVFPSEINPPIAPRFMESNAELGTMTIEPFSFNPSNNMFIPRRCSAIGLFWYCNTCLSEFFCDFGFSSSQNHSGFSLPFCLCLLAHGIGKSRRYNYIPYSDCLAGYSPGICV